MKRIPKPRIQNKYRRRTISRIQTDEHPNSNKLGEIVTDVADVLGEGAVEVAAQVGPMVNEAAADSLLPVALLQYLIGHVHTISGLNWWASIVLTTILIRWSLLPLRINQTKSNLLRPRLEAINEDMLNRDMNPAAVAEGQARMKELFKELRTWQKRFHLFKREESFGLLI